MSYDLMVFAPSAAPRDRADFLAWFKEQIKWSEGHGYNDPAVSDPGLRAWFLDAIRTFPAQGGPYASTASDGDGEADELRSADYSLARNVIYVAFAWPHAGEAYELVLELARRHALGVFDVSSSLGEAYFPDAGGQLTLAHLDEEEHAKKQRLDGLVAWVKSGEGSVDTWLSAPRVAQGANDDAAVFEAERSAATQRVALQARLGRNRNAPTWVTEATVAWRLALGLMLSAEAPHVEPGARRAALLSQGPKENTWRRLTLGDDWTLLYPAPSATRADSTPSLCLPGTIRHDFTCSLSELGSWLARTGQSQPEALAQSLASAAASAVLGQDTEFREGQLIAYRTVVAGPAADPSQISLSEARGFDDVVKPGEELGFGSSFSAWLFPLLDWLHDPPSA